MLLSTVAVPVLSAGTTTATSISLSWTSAGSEDVKYVVVWQTDNVGGCSGGSNYRNSSSITNGSTNYHVMELEENTNYTILVTSNVSSNNINTMTQVAGKTNSRNGCQSMIEECCSLAPTGPPTQVNTTTTSTTITVQWGPVDCIHRNGDITGYSVCVISNEFLKKVSTSGDTRNATISELRPFTDYNISVAADNSVGTGVYSDHLVATTERNQC